MKDTVKIGIIGLGNVGVGTVKILQKHAAMIQKRVGARCVVKSICDIKIDKCKKYLNPILPRNNSKKVGGEKIKRP